MVLCSWVQGYWLETVCVFCNLSSLKLFEPSLLVRESPWDKGSLCQKGWQPGSSWKKSMSKPYKWDKEKWEKDEEWWNPYNPAGRLKGKGTTSWARQMRRQALHQQPLEKEAKKTRTGWRAASRIATAFGKKARGTQAAKTAIGKMAEENKPAFGKKGRSIK